LLRKKNIQALSLGCVLGVAFAQVAPKVLFAEDIEECEERVEKHRNFQIKSVTCGSEGLLRVFSGNKVTFETKNVYTENYALHPKLDQIFFQAKSDIKAPKTIQRLDLKSNRLTQVLNGKSLAFVKSVAKKSPHIESAKDVLVLVSKGRNELSAVYLIDLQDQHNAIKQIPLTRHSKKAPVIESVTTMPPEATSPELFVTIANETGNEPVSVLVSDKKVASVYTLNDEAMIEALAFDADCKALVFAEASLSDEEKILSLKPVVMIPGKKPLIFAEIPVKDADSVTTRRVQKGKAQISWNETKMIISKAKKTKTVDYGRLCNPD